MNVELIIKSIVHTGIRKEEEEKKRVGLIQSHVDTDDLVPVRGARERVSVSLTDYRYMRLKRSANGEARKQDWTKLNSCSRDGITWETPR